MNLLTDEIAWKKLQEHWKSMEHFSIPQAFVAEPARFNHYSLEAAGIFLDYSKNKMTDETLQLLVDLATQRQLPEAIESLFMGKVVNKTENRAALHTALRNLNKTPVIVDQQDIMPEIIRTLDRVRSIADAVADGSWCGYSQQSIRDVVNIGIGGSDLGPAMACAALSSYTHAHFNTHFVSNLDSKHLNQVLRQVDPETTLFIIVSKSFTTEETLINANLAREWLIRAAGGANSIRHQFIAITSTPQLAEKFGIYAENILPLWDWVGGRYSVWSAVGLSLAISIGMTHFYQFLEGAQAMDQHFRYAPFLRNIPIMLALLSIWYNNFYGCPTHAVIPYDQHLHLLTPYLQQLHMESKGKRVTTNGTLVNYNTGTILWGGVGTNSQHAFHQLLMQGTHKVPIDFILPLNTQDQTAGTTAQIVSHCLSQAQALMQGKSAEEVLHELLAQGMDHQEAAQLVPHKIIPGNCPSNMILLESLTPYTLGALLALYEHKIFVQSTLWDINPFDQWGVERGKQLAQQIYRDLQLPTTEHQYDASTQGLIAFYRQVINRVNK